MLQTKKTHQSTIFQTFEWFNESSPNSSCHWSRFIQILNHCSVSWKITPLYFLAQTFILWTKRTNRSEIFTLLAGLVKICQILYDMFETTSQFFLNFASLFNVMRDTSSVLYKLKMYMIWTKRAHQSAIFKLSTVHVKIRQICTLISSFCWKNIKFQGKKYRGVMSDNTEEWCPVWGTTDLLFQKW